MTLNDWAAVSTIAQAILVVISLGFIWYQLRESTKLAKAENVRALVEQAAAFHAPLYQDGQLGELWYTFGRKFRDDTEKLKYHEMIVQWLLFHENIYYQHSQGLLAEEIYQSWLVDLKATMGEHNTDLIDIKGLFPGQYGLHLLELKEAFKTNEKH